MTGESSSPIYASKNSAIGLSLIKPAGFDTFRSAPMMASKVFTAIFDVN